jgi:dTDP-4-amino-4,6-dideoxygalactose transaminase
MKVPFLDLLPAYQEFRGEFDAAYRRVMDSGRYLLGPELESFESELAQFVGTEFCVGVANGLEALQLVLMAHGVGPGDEVVVPSNGYIATWFAASQVGATIVPCEPDPRTFNLDPARLLSAISAQTKVILPVHLYGQTADIDAINEIARGRGIFVLEDAAQSHGATCRGQAAGSLGAAAGLSFYPTKNLGAFADAGAVTTQDAKLADRVRLLRNYGSRTRYHNEAIGLNSRLDELQAAFLRVKLRHLAEGNRLRSRLAARYGEQLAGVGDLILPFVPDWADPVWHLFVVRTKYRDALRDHLAAAGIGSDVHYPTPPHLSGAYRSVGWKTGDFPIAERLAGEVLSLPLNPHLTSGQLDLVCDAIKHFFAHTSGRSNPKR